MKLIPLTQGKFALVDDEDYDFLMQWKWCFIKGKNGNGYAARGESFINKKGKRRCHRFWMHREINGTLKKLNTDHRDGNGLNNQRYNLRDATCTQNSMNSKKMKNCSSIYKGVHLYKRDNTWVAKIRMGGKQKHLGYFPIDKESEAAKAYNEAAIKIHGEFAKLNEVPSCNY